MSAPTPRLDPQKLSPADAARSMSRVSGRHVAESTIEADVAAGAPTNGDGTHSLVAYGAWHVRQLAEGDPHGDWSTQSAAGGELCRLLNSTPFGTVISERQLYRHRVRAGYRRGDENKIDLLRYVAWLVEEVHRPRATTPSEDYAALKGRSRARNAAIAKAGRDIGEVPAVVDPMLHECQRNELRRRVVEDDVARTMSSIGNRSESKRWLD